MSGLLTLDPVIRARLEALVHFEYRTRNSKMRNMSVARSKKPDGGDRTFHLFDPPSYRAMQDGYPVSLASCRTSSLFVSAETFEKALRDERSHEYESLVLDLCSNLGKQSNRLILEALEKTPSVAGSAADGLSLAKIDLGFERLASLGVPDDEQRFAVVGWPQWSDLLAISEFADADYVMSDAELPWPGVQAKRWRKTMWLPHSELAASAGIRVCHWFHREAVGHVVGESVSICTKQTETGDYELVADMPQAAMLIDRHGAVQLHCKE